MRRVAGSARPPVVQWHARGNGEPLLLLNGWTASGLLWPAAWLRGLERRFRVIRIDNRGTGWSRGASAPFTIADMADDAAAVLRACGTGTAAVLGLSMGGMIAQELAVRHPGLVSRLILVGTRPPTPAQIPSDPAKVAIATRPPRPDETLGAYFRSTWSAFAAPGFAEAHPEVMDELVSHILRRPTPRAGVRNQLRAIGAWHAPERLTRLAVPTVVVHGERDPLMPVGNGMRLARLIPDAGYRELPGVGHLVPYEAGDELTRILEPADTPVHG